MFCCFLNDIRFRRIQPVGKLCQFVRDFLVILAANIGFHKFLDVDWLSLERSSYSVSSGFFSDCGYDHHVISGRISDGITLVSMIFFIIFLLVMM